MENKLNKFVKYPILVIAAVISISGIRWLVSSEPWILDQVANEERLAMTFNELFLIEGNLKTNNAVINTKLIPEKIFGNFKYIENKYSFS